MSELTLPALVFHTRKKMHYLPINPHYCRGNDIFCEDDMRFDDISDSDLIQRYGLNHISDRVDIRHMKPYLGGMRRKTFSVSARGFGMPETLSKEEVAEILFDEMRELAGFFSRHGDYRELIYKMIDHFQENRPGIFTDPLFDRALCEHVENDKPDSSSLEAIKNSD